MVALAKSDETSMYWSALRRGDPASLQHAEIEAKAIARALAVESLVSDQDSELAELAERRRHLARQAWPDRPFEGFEMQSSLGALVVARVAVAWVPSGHTGLRYTPLTPDGVTRALVNQGVDRLAAQSVVGSWSGPSSSFKGDESGLETGLLAGLAERSLTPKERDLALSQVAVSPRDLSRLGTTILLARAVSQLLPMLADDQLGGELVAALALVSTQRSRRALELLEGIQSSPAQQTVFELAQTLEQFSGGYAVEFSDDQDLPDYPKRAASVPVGGTTPESDEEARSTTDGDDVLEIIEESVDENADSGQNYQNIERPTWPQWWPGVDSETSDSAQDLWRSLAVYRTEARRRGTILGFQASPFEPRGGLIPPDPRYVSRAKDEEKDMTQSAMDPFLPAVRVALRVVAKATEGEIVDVEGAEGLSWVLQRAAAVAHLKNGELDLGLEVLSARWPDEAPELRWLRDRKMRFDGREVEPLTSEEARQAASTLVLDIARSLARTLTGAFPDVADSTRDDR